MRLRTWHKATIGLLAAIIIVLVALGGTGAYFFFRNLEKKISGEADANGEIDVVRKRYAPRAPLVEIVDPRTGDIRINREKNPAATPVRTIHIISWESETNELMQTEVPLWLMRFSSVNLLSRLGMAPARFRLTVDDIQGYGPGVVADYRSPGASRVLIWVE